MKLQLTKNNQHFMTLPLSVINALGWKKGDDLLVSVTGKDRIQLDRVREKVTSK